MSETPQIWVTVETDEFIEETTAVTGERDGSEDIGAGWGTAEKLTEAVKRVTRRKRVTLDAKMLKDQMAGLLMIVDDLFEQASQLPQMKLDELELSVEINGEGEVSLVGNSAKLGSGGGITMKFTAK